MGEVAVNYYNEWDAYPAQWLRNLIAAGLIPKGHVDERSIIDIQPGELAGYTQCHFFAGIGGWSLALQLAGWPADKPVWTGSCPCQPYSVAGKQSGDADERNLWPEMFRLITACRPERVFGEQVEGAVKHGWLNRVYTDLEAENYSCGSAVLGAHSVGAPHIRQRLYWLADHTERLGNTTGNNQRGARQPEESGRWEGAPGRSGAWSDYDIVNCIYEKARRIESRTFPLANGVPARVGKLRAYGNAIIPQVAAEFIKAYIGDCHRDTQEKWEK